jgi:hypothetical protein
MHENEKNENYEHENEHDLEILMTGRRVGMSMPGCDGSNDLREGVTRGRRQTRKKRDAPPARDAGANAVVEESSSLAPSRRDWRRKGLSSPPPSDHTTVQRPASMKKTNFAAIWVGRAL